MEKVKSVLSIAGSDSSGGAGIQADIKTIEAQGLFAETAITSLTAQNTTGVYGVKDVDPEFVEAQIDVVFADIVPDAIKIGMVSTPEVAQAIARALQRNKAQNIVLDPVMVATSGSALMKTETVQVLVEELFPLASIITPNLAESKVLFGHDILNESDIRSAARSIAQTMTAGAVLIKGGHCIAGEGTTDALSDKANDYLYLLQDDRFICIEGARINTHNTHGTGCTLSAAIACGLACGKSIEESVRDAKAYVSAALSAGLNLGKGCGPLDHLVHAHLK